MRQTARKDQRSLALAVPATLNRLQPSNHKRTRCHKLAHDPRKVQACLLALGVRCLPKRTREIVVNLDARGHVIHGTQAGRHFNACYGDYYYVPLYVLVGEVPPCGRNCAPAITTRPTAEWRRRSP